MSSELGVGSRAELAARLGDDTATDVATATRGPRDFVWVGHGLDAREPPATWVPQAGGGAAS